jgi:carboxypeptidase T
MIGCPQLGDPKMKMRSNGFVSTLLAALCLSFLTATSQAATPKRLLVKIDRSYYKAHYNEIHAAGLDVAGMNIPKGTVDLIVTQEDFDTLRKMGIPVPRTPLEVTTRGPDSKYKTPDQVAQLLAGYQTAYPAIAQVTSIGKSLQGRDILAIRITQNVSQPDGNKPAILYNGMHHAREVMSTEVPLDIADYLLTNYGKDAKVTHWINSDVIYVVPMLNPDGNNLVWTQDNMWRKNARGNYGVDINRNYPYQWNRCDGSSSSKSADDYRGPSAASEPETNVVMNFVTSIHPVFDISFHSYSEIVIYPYGCGGHTETANVVEPLGQQMAALIPSDDGSGHYTAGLAPDLLYPVDGSDLDWMYHVDHVIPYVIEVNSDSEGFQPSYDDWRDKTVNAVRPAWQLLLDRMDGPSIRGNVHGIKMTQVTVKGATFTENYPVHVDGSYHMVLNPGDYQLTFTGPNQTPQTKTVHVGATRTHFDLN